MQQGDYDNGVHISNVKARGTYASYMGEANNNLVVLHTVAATEEFYINRWSINCHTVSNGLGYLCIYDTGPALRETIYYYAFQERDQHGFGLDETPPIRVLPGETVRVFSSIVDLFFRGIIRGYTYNIA